MERIEYEQMKKVVDEEISIYELINFDQKAKNSVKISIVIPVYNVEKYLKKCLDSVGKQTLSDIEIICIDDCSTDNSVKILDSYANDIRYKIIKFDSNYSASIARKKGVEMASGKYLMFVDADDELDSRACEDLYSLMEEKKVDIIHFGTRINNCANLPQKRMEYMIKFVKPYIGELLGNDVFSACFEKGKYQFSLWNKIYQTSLLKTAFDYIENIPLPKAQDKYLYFVISYFAKSYIGIEDIYYTYNFGQGVTGHNELDMVAFEKYCSMGATSAAIKRFIEKVDKKRCEKAFENSHRGLLFDCINNWNNLTENYEIGFEKILDYFGKAETVGAIAKNNWWNATDIVGKIKKSKYLEFDKDIKTIATYYHKLECGGVQMVLVKLTKIWLELGYRVIVLTDCPPCKGDYDLPLGVERIVIPSYFETTKENYMIRAKAIENIITEYSIDLMVYHAWVSQMLLWDLLVFKLNKVKFAIHCHNIFSMPLLNTRVFFSNLPYIYSLADGVVVLSDTDEEYWKNFNKNVVKVVNPVRYDNLSHVGVSNISGHNIIWCARLSDEKRPLDAIEIFREVHRVIPTANLFILGKGTSIELIKKIKAKITDYGLEESVMLFGYQKDVQMFQELATVNLMTSEYEGFPLGLLEGMLASMPTVMYNLPYLSIVEKGKGIIVVEEGNITKAANEVINLLSDEEKRKNIGIEARISAEEFLSFDYATVWSTFIKSMFIKQKQRNEVPKMWGILFSHYEKGVKKINLKNEELKKIVGNYEEKIKKYDTNSMLKIEELSKELDYSKKKLKELEKNLADTRIKYEKEGYELQEIKKSFSYKIAMILTWIPRKLRAIWYGGKD